MSTRPSSLLPSSTLLAYLGLVLAMVIWASSFVAQKHAFTQLPPMVVTFGRMAVACLAFLLLSRNFRSIRLHPGDWWRILLMALFEPCLYFLLETSALTRTSASQAGVITTMLPVLVAVAARLYLKERTTPLTLAGFGLALLGSVWLSAGALATIDSPNPALGNFLEFLAMVAATGYTISAKQLVLRYPPLFLTAAQAVVGAVFFAPLALASPMPPLHDIPWEAVLATIYLGLFVTLVAYWLYNLGLSRVPASQTAAFINLIPVFTIILGWLVLGETLTGSQYAASLLILVGVGLSQRRPGASKASG